jgi:hypothetical protein
LEKYDNIFKRYFFSESENHTVFSEIYVDFGMMAVTNESMEIMHPGDYGTEEDHKKPTSSVTVFSLLTNNYKFGAEI